MIYLCMRVCIYACMRALVLTCMRVCMHSCIHTEIQMIGNFASFTDNNKIWTLPRDCQRQITCGLVHINMHIHTRSTKSTLCHNRCSLGPLCQHHLKSPKENTSMGICVFIACHPETFPRSLITVSC